jgi:hypothetical protein
MKLTLLGLLDGVNLYPRGGGLLVKSNEPTAKTEAGPASEIL